LPISRTPENPSRAALAARLGSLRQQSGLSGNAFAKRMGVVQSRVWKIEHGELLPNEADIRAWAEAAGQPEEVASELTDLLGHAHVEYETWKTAYRKGGGAAAQQAAYVAVEERSSLIGEFQIAMFPGIVQTAAYAREILALPSGPLAWGSTPDEIEAMVDSRMRRQEVALYDAGKRVQIVLGEAALRTLVCTPPTLAGQLRKLLVIDALPTVELGVIGFHQHMPVYPFTAFSIRDELVVIDHLTGEQTIDDVDEVASWLRFFDLLREAASTGDAARRLIQSAIEAIADGEA
jgi:transcriptional regulator with XRE-family HTH domain